MMEESNVTQNNMDVDPLNTTRPALIFLTVMMPIGVLGNLFVLYIYGCRLKKSPLNMFIFILAIYDILSCLFGIPLEITSILYTFRYPSSILCKLDKLMVFFTCTSSELTLLAISLERYNKVCRFNKFQLGICHAKLAAIPINIIAILISIPPIVYFNKVDYKGMSICMNIVPYSKLQHYFIGLLILNFIIIILMLILYILVREKAKQCLGEKGIPMREDNTTDFKRTISVNKKKGHRINHIIASVTVLFIISFIPSLLLGVTYPLLENVRLSVSVERLRQLSLRLWILNSSLNPVVYGMLNDRFQKEFLKIFGQLCNIKIFSTSSSTDTAHTN
ncbi:C3a anaphylatoxin chemotactic receptor-like [Argonauta hians]